jgi:hypothetical protein
MSVVRFGEPAWEQILWAVCRVAGSAYAAAIFDARRIHPEAPRREDPHSKSALEGERKQVTVLFADLKGSMKLPRIRILATMPVGKHFPYFALEFARFVSAMRPKEKSSRSLDNRGTQ